MCITKIKIDVRTADGAKCGLVFLSADDLTDEKYAAQMKEFDNWTIEDYKKIDRTLGRKWWVCCLNFFLV